MTENICVEILKIKETEIQSKHFIPGLVCIIIIIINGFYNFSINFFII